MGWGGVIGCEVWGQPLLAYVGGCQNYGPFLDPCYNTAPTIWGIQKGTIILTATHVWVLYKDYYKDPVSNSPSSTGKLRKFRQFFVSSLLEIQQVGKGA